AYRHLPLEAVLAGGVRLLTGLGLVRRVHVRAHVGQRWRDRLAHPQPQVVEPSVRGEVSLVGRRERVLVDQYGDDVSGGEVTAIGRPRRPALSLRIARRRSGGDKSCEEQQTRAAHLSLPVFGESRRTTPSSSTIPSKRRRVSTRTRTLSPTAADPIADPLSRISSAPLRHTS